MVRVGDSRAPSRGFVSSENSKGGKSKSEGDETKSSSSSSSKGDKKDPPPAPPKSDGDSKTKGIRV